MRINAEKASMNEECFNRLRMLIEQKDIECEVDMKERLIQMERT